MMRTFRFAALLCLVTATVLHAQAPRVTRVGAPRTFGLTILHASLAELRFELGREAQVIVLQVDPAGGITPMFPTDSEPGLRPPGAHFLTGPAPTAAATPDDPRLDPVMRSADELARGGRAVRPPAVSMGDESMPILAYWLVIVSDVPTSAREVRAQLQSAALDFGSVQDELKALPGVLIAERTKQWGAFYAAVR